MQRLLVVILLGYNLSVPAQSNLDFWKIDSLCMRMEAAVPEIEKLLESKDHPPGDYFFLKALSLSDDRDSALYYFQQAEQSYRKSEEIGASHIAYAYQAGVLRSESRYQKGLEMLQGELEYAILHEERYLHFYSLITLFKLNYHLNNFLKANQYLEEARELVGTERKAALVKVHYYKMIVYQSLVMGKVKLDSGYATNSHCVKLADKVIPLLDKNNYQCLLSKAWVIRTFSLYSGNLASEDSCISSLDRALQIALEGNCPEPFEFALANKARYMAKIGRSLGDPDEILQMLNTQPRNLSHLGWAHQIVSGVYAAQGEWQNAYISLNKASDYHMKLYHQQNAEALAEQAVKFETFKKERENERLAGQIAIEQSQKQKLWLFFSLIILLLVGGALLYWIHYRNKVRHREQQIMIRHLLEGEQKERIRVARDLHDSVGQLLSALKLQVRTLDEGSVKHRQAGELLDKTIEEVRSISHNLLPKALDYFGLQKAIEDMAEQYNSTGTLNFEVNSVGGHKPVKLSKHQELWLFRIIQENVQNIIKHSGSKEIGINIFHKEEELLIDIIYEGPRMSLEKVEDSRGIGWKNIMARIKLLNGEIAFDQQGSESVIRMKVRSAA